MLKYPALEAAVAWLGLVGGAVVVCLIAAVQHAVSEGTITSGPFPPAYLRLPVAAPAYRTGLPGRLPSPTQCFAPPRTVGRRAPHGTQSGARESPLCLQAAVAWALILCAQSQHANIGAPPYAWQRIRGSASSCAPACFGIKQPRDSVPPTVNAPRAPPPGHQTLSRAGGAI